MEEVRAAKERALITREEQKVKIQSDMGVLRTEALQQASVLMTKVNADKDIVESQARKEVMEMMNEVEAKCNARRIEAEEKARVAEIETDALLQATRLKYEALLKEARAEARDISGYETRRNYEVEMARAEVLEQVARRGKIVMSGENGDMLLKGFTGVKKA